MLLLQVKENMGAMGVVPKLTEQVLARIEAIVGTKPKSS